jgi:hypothetical protein
MKKNPSLFISLLLLLIIVIACGKKHAVDTLSSDSISDQEALETQRNVNRYFHSQVIPKLEHGWSELKDTGKYVTYHYRYIKKHNRWEFNEMEKMESTLSPHNDTVAQRFMAKAVVGSFFPIEKRLEKDSVFDLYWTWRCLFRKEHFDQNTGEFKARQMMAEMAQVVCDGKGTKAYCKACGEGNTCINVCVGYSECSVDRTSCLLKRYCASEAHSAVLQPMLFAEALTPC